MQISVNFNWRKLCWMCFWVCCAYLHSAHAQRLHSDNGNGTFTNPVIPGDFPDPDVIRVGNTYYMVSTTMFVFPGVTILKSKDLVNWEYCSNAVPRFDFNEGYNLIGGNRYGRGQWATSIKYHHGKFHMLFVTLDEGGFTCTATNASGPWEIKKLSKGFYDPGLFYDDDGKIYVAHGYGKINITQVNESFAPVSKDSLVFTGNIRGGLEGSHVYKINGYYYLYSTYGGPKGIQVALRSRNIYGPYEQKVVLNDTTSGVNRGIHQGALIKTQTGGWWTMLFVDRGPFGRTPSLQPVTWVDGWPMVGVNGKAVATYRKPHIGKSYPVKTLPTSDDFNSQLLGLQWGWNHNPEPAGWSITQRKGYLRLKNTSIAANFTMARNTLTQRPLIKYNLTRPTVGTAKIDVAHMHDGDIAGLAVLQMPYAYIAVQQRGKNKSIVMVNNGLVVDSVKAISPILYLRVTGYNESKKAFFEYSYDNLNFRALGNELAMQFSLKMFTGNKYCLFNYATKAIGGYVDFDWFRMN